MVEVGRLTQEVEEKIEEVEELKANVSSQPRFKST